MAINDLNKNMLSLVTENDGDPACDTGLATAASGYVRVFVATQAIAVSGDRDGLAFWSNDDGATALPLQDLPAGAKLHWNRSHGRVLTGSESVEFDYEAAE